MAGVMRRLELAPRNGTLIVTRDNLDRRASFTCHGRNDYFRDQIAALREAAASTQK